MTASRLNPCVVAALLALAACALPGHADVAVSRAASGAASRAALFDAQGYRTARFRSPVDRDPAPAIRISLSGALALSPDEALFVDVTPVEGGVRDPATGSWRLSEGHETIPGASWYPETGRSPVDPVLWQGLRAAVAGFRRSHPGVPVIVFCRSDCWMSWNAARRLARDHVRNVRWLAEGNDGWHAAGRPLVAAIPVSVPPTNP